MLVMNPRLREFLMIQLDLTEAEAAILREVVESALSNLSYEIADTDRQDFRNDLKARRDVLKKVQDALDQPGDT